MPLERAPRLRHIVDVEIAHAQRPYLAFVDQPLHRGHRLRQRMTGAPMQEVDIEIVRTEAAQ